MVSLVMTNPEQKRFWVLSELYYPEESATGYYATKIAEALAATHDVRVLCAQPTYKSRGMKAPVDEVRNNVRIHRCAATTLNKDVLPFRILNLLTISGSVFFNALRNIRQGDIALVVTNPPALPFLAYIACRLRRAKLILRVEDVYPEAMIAAGLVGPRSVLVRFLNLLQRHLYVNVERVIVLGRDMMHLVKGKTGPDARHITIITNWADADQIRPLDRSTNPLLHRLDLLDRFVVQYSGNMGRTHDLESLIECASILLRHQEIHFLFIGAGAKASSVRRAAQELALSNVTILPPQPRTELAISLNACDLAVISFVKGMAGVSVPSRMYNILAAGKPILAVADRESELAQVVEEEHVGWVVPPVSPDLVAKAIVDAAANRTSLSEMSRRARELVLSRYSHSHVMAKFEELVGDLGLSGNPASRSSP